MRAAGASGAASTGAAGACERLVGLRRAHYPQDFRSLWKPCPRVPGERFSRGDGRNHSTRGAEPRPRRQLDEPREKRGAEVRTGRAEPAASARQLESRRARPGAGRAAASSAPPAAGRRGAEEPSQKPSGLRVVGRAPASRPASSSGRLARQLDGAVEAAELVDQPVRAGVVAGPDAALRHRLDRGALEAAAGRRRGRRSGRRSRRIWRRKSALLLGRRTARARSRSRRWRRASADRG